MSMTLWVEQTQDDLRRAMLPFGEALRSPVDNQVLVQVRDDDRLLGLAQMFSQQGWYLVTVVGNDERELEDHCFKIYYVLSHPAQDLFAMIEYLLDRGSVAYPSLYALFPSVDRFEQEMLDMLGLVPRGQRSLVVRPGAWLHEGFGPGLAPLRRAPLAPGADGVRRATFAPDDSLSPAVTPAAGPGAAPRALLLPVGPVHAGVIEPGRFQFTIAGEAIDDVDLQLGYTHRGMEWLFQTHLDLLEGWWLAEQVAGDSSIAHALAYCRAAEMLTVAEVPPAAELVRSLVLELERIHNHVADVAALAADVAMDLLASRGAVLREDLLRLNSAVSGHRFLRGVVRAGGVVLPGDLDIGTLRCSLDRCLEEFAQLAVAILGRPAVRDRTIGVGVLTAGEVVKLGATGLAARASGVLRDSRREHPTGAYTDAHLREIGRLDLAPAPSAGEESAGDVYARFLTRVHEVQASRAMVHVLLDRWDDLTRTERGRLLVEPASRPEHNYTFAVGQAEGFRGDVVYWLMQDKMGGVYRCKVRDPSVLNWPALRRSVLPRRVDGRSVETLLSDFPLVNKSFNLSYAGNDA
jgi:Ni,Fe-hydrogenase III large subunit/Ni,Fe-hydrogenase III component G